MSGTHKYPTISFRISPREREEIEAKILASGMSKKDYFVRSCIYNRVCVVGRKELIYQLVEELKIMQTNIREVTEQFEKTEIDLTPHMLRRYFANMRRKAGWRLELIQQALGHKHIDTTIKYLNIVDDELLEASQEFYEKHSAMYGVEKLL